MWRTPVILTDLPTIVPNLSHNVELNRSTVEALGGDVEAGALTWGGSKEESDPRFLKLNEFKVNTHRIARFGDRLTFLFRSYLLQTPFTMMTIRVFLLALSTAS